MTDFGRVFHMTVAVKDGRAAKSSGVFMVIGPAAEAIIREKEPTYRLTVCLAGWGYWGLGQRVEPGAIVPTKIDDPRVEWLDEE